jgi:hypothetical protein
MMHRTGVILITLLLSSAAQAYYVTFQQWQAMPELDRKSYIAGAIDSFVYDNSSFLLPPSSRAAALHFETCLSRAKMSNGQLAANVLNFASDKPKLQTGPVQSVLIDYLVAACGMPPNK